MTDPELLGLVHAAFTRTDGVPAHTQQAARDAFRWLDPAPVLAELTDDLVPAGVRSETRLLTFTGPGVAIELEITPHDLTGRLVPPTAAHIEIRHPSTPGTAHADRHGHFTFPRPSAGLLSLTFHLPDATSIVTSWIRL